MQVRCPQCHNPIDFADDTAFDEICCSSCGSSFSLIGSDATRTYRAENRQLAQFELLRELGLGKFGSVWLARDTQLDRTVAIKIPRKGTLDAKETEAFLRDARAAAQLKHPNIVGVHEVGREGDTVYIVSDYIKGANLKEYLSGQRLSFRESAELIVKVAEALDHAHRAGVVHRDLKPGNIMIDVDGQPYVIDFGLAKRETGEITMTVDGNVVGTPAYMSPEQATGKGHEADRRSDVYSLGVVLFELLTGELPFRGERQMLLLQIERDEPPRPRKLNARIPRDVETITLKCLEKEPAKRYRTAKDLADDLQRWLRGEPVLARPVGRLERRWRWAKRNPSVAGLAAAVLLLLATVAVGSTIAAVRIAVARNEADARAKEALAEKATATAERERALASQTRAQEAEARATEDAEKAKRVAQFLAGMFESSAPHEQSGFRFRGPTSSEDSAKLAAARELLKAGAKKVVDELNDQPAVQAALMETIGNASIGLGLVDSAEPLLEKSLEIRRRLHPEPHLDTATSLCSLAVLRAMQIQFDESIDAIREALTIRNKLLGADHKDAIDAKHLLAMAMVANGETTTETEGLWRDVISWRTAHLGKENSETAFAMAGLAATLAARGDTSKAAPLFMQATVVLIKDPETTSFGQALVEDQQARLMWTLKQWKSAVDISGKAVKHFLEYSTDDHPLFGQIAGTHTKSLQLAGRADEAKHFLRDWLKRLRDRDSQALASPVGSLVECLVSIGDPADLEEAETVCREWLTSLQESGRRPGVRDAQARSALAIILSRKAAKTRDRNDFDEAEAAGRTVIEVSKELLVRLPRDQEGYRRSVATCYTRGVFALGSLLRAFESNEESEALYRDSLTVSRQFIGEFHTLVFTKALAEAVQSQGRSDEAEELCREGLQLVDAASFISAQNKTSWRSEMTCLLADSLAKQGKHQEAEELYRKVQSLGDKEWAPRAKQWLTELGGEKQP